MAEAPHTPEPVFKIALERIPTLPASSSPAGASIRIGIHTSIAGDIVRSLDLAYRLGSNTLQIFSSSPRAWAPPGKGERISAVDARRFHERREALGLGPLIIHGNYLINFASREPMLRARSIQAFRGELLRALALGGDFLVAHPGSSRGAQLRDALAAVADALREAARGLGLNGLRVLLENTAGQGSAVGSRLEELKAILDLCPELPLGICIDTAHLFAAGYDVRSAEGLERVLDSIDSTVGLDRVPVLHVNDSKTPFRSRRDRHEHIGKGEIGLEAFGRLLHHPRLAGRAFILETPIDRPGDDRRNVRTLWKLLGRDAPHIERGFSMLRRPRWGWGGRSRRHPAARNRVSRRRRLRPKSRGG